MWRVINFAKQICGPSKGPGGNKPQKYFLLGSWAFFALVGLLIPSDILEHAWARQFSDAMAVVIPQIDRITALGLKPNINRFHYSLLWAASPAYLIILIIAGNKNVVLGYNQLSYARIIGSLLFGTYIFNLTMFLWVGPGFVQSGDHAARIAFYKPITRGISAPLFAIAPSFSVAGILLIIKGMITGHIFKEKGGGPHGG